MAETWNAVLLVDEADIFLEQRKTRDLARNGLISGKQSYTPRIRFAYYLSAIWRRMEHLKGLPFLRTNRVRQIDDASMSRVHVAIGCEQLTPKVRQDI